MALIEQTRYWLRINAGRRDWSKERIEVRRRLQRYEAFLAKVRAFAQSYGLKLRRVSANDVRAFARIKSNRIICDGLVDQIRAAIPPTSERLRAAA
jgi:hypothetical protein